MRVSCPHQLLKKELAVRIKVCQETWEIKCRECHAHLTVGSTESKGEKSQ